MIHRQGQQMDERERETLDHSFCDESEAEAFKGKSPKAVEGELKWLI